MKSTNMQLNKYFSLAFIMLFSVVIMAQEPKKDVKTITREQVLEMDIEELSAYDLEEIMKIMDIVGASTIEELYELLLNKDVTSASKSEESLFDSPLSTTVLSYDEILESGATSIEEALRLVPGVIVREKTNGNYDVQIRGGQNMPMNNLLLYAENTTTLVMIDNRPVFNYGMGGILWETLPVSIGELDRIEVVRGPSSALYGPNAVNGVINLITKNPDAESPLVNANFEGGSLSTLIGDINVKKTFSDKFAAGVSSYIEKRDRNSDKIYSIYDDEYIDLETYDERNSANLWSNDVASELFDDPREAKNKLGFNAYLNYQANENIKFDINAGYLDALANTSTIGDNPTPYNIRSSYGYYSNFNAEIYGFNFMAASNNVIQDFNKGHKGWTQATEQYNLNLDYLIKVNKLDIRPGISYQSVHYDDRNYIDQLGEGYFNDRMTLRNYALSARFDYSPIDQLRFVAALRTEKYNVPDKWMPSYQFIGSYKVNENNLLRAVFSRANQSTFMINAFSNYTWNRDGLGTPEYIRFDGNSDPNMMVMDMVELGFRSRPSKNLLIDIEAFYNKAKNFSALMPDKIETVTFTDPTSGLDPQLGQFAKTTLYTSHRSLDLESKQYGLSISADMVLSEKLIMKAHMTYQKTTVDNFMNYSRDQIAIIQSAYVPGMQTDIEAFLTGASQTPPAPLYSSDAQPDPSTYKNNFDNEAIPAFWGSLGITYKPVKKLSITAQGYFYDKYYMYTQYDSNAKRLYIAGINPSNPYKDVPTAIVPEVKGKLDYTGNIVGKFLLNAKVNYQLSDNIDVYINGRNVLDNDKQEFMMMDKIGALYLAGINVSF